MSPSTGTLFVVSMPIGHPDDITLRALATLRHVTVVASEDPRMTQALLAHHGITTTITSYGPLNRDEKIRILLHRLNSCSVCEFSQVWVTTCTMIFDFCSGLSLICSVRRSLHFHDVLTFLALKIS